MNDAKKPCSCHKTDDVVISRRALSHAAGGTVLVAGILCMVCYWTGKRVALDHVDQVFDRNYLVDHIATQLYCNNDTSRVVDDTPDDEPVPSGDLVLVQNESGAPELAIAQELIQKALGETIAENIVGQNDNKKYYAQLIGFGSKTAAQKFVSDLSSKGIATQLKAKQSRSVRGKKITWYQVVTNEYENPAELDTLVHNIRMIKKLHDIRMVTC